ncbi:MAG TPA: TolC family outer membrane protein [Telluria sp.]|nr:TolC family outer membrane protein [Telluria sp.]
MTSTTRPHLPLRAAALAAAMWLLAPQAGAITLMQAYQAALQNDPQYRVAKAERDVGKENRIIGRSALLPQVSASYSGSKVRADIDYGLSPTTGLPVIRHPLYYSRSEVVQLRQPLFSVDSYARYKQGIAQTNYSDAVFDARTKEIAVRVVSAYLDVLYAEEQLGLSKAQVATLEEQRKVNDRLFQKGEGTRTDMLETQARLDMAQATVLEAQDNLTNARRILSGIIGREVEGVDGLAPNFATHPLTPGNFSDWQALALKNNPDLIAANYAIEASRMEVMKSRSGHMPRVDLVASYSQSDSDTINSLDQNTTQRAIGVQVNIPIYAGGYVSATSRQAVANLEKARAQLDAQMDKTLTDLRKEYNGVLTTQSKIAALDKAVASSEELVKATEQSIKGGVRINLDLLNARQQMYQNLRDRAQARYNYLLSNLRLKAAAGTLVFDDIRQVAAYFR